MFINGKISDGVSGLPIPDVHLSVFVNGKRNQFKGAVSNQNGVYSIDVYPGEEYHISHKSFDTLVISGTKLFSQPNQKLFPGTNMLDEITLTPPKKKKLWPWITGIALMAIFTIKKQSS